MWGELFMYRYFTRNNLRTVWYNEEWITPTMRLEGGGEAFNFDLLVSFGAKCVVAIMKDNREAPHSLGQLAGWTGYFVGYGATTGQEGCYRVFKPDTKKV